MRISYLDYDFSRLSWFQEGRSNRFFSFGVDFSLYFDNLNRFRNRVHMDNALVSSSHKLFFIRKLKYTQISNEFLRLLTVIHIAANNISSSNLILIKPFDSYFNILASQCERHFLISSIIYLFYHHVFSRR